MSAAGRQGRARPIGCAPSAAGTGVPFVDLQRDTSRTYDAKGMQLRICDAAMDGAFLINMPVLKGHCQTHVTSVLKNAKSVIPNAA